MTAKKQNTNGTGGVLPSWLFSAVFGAFLGLSLLKFGNPPTLAKLVEPPTNVTEWIIMGWPAEVGYWLLGVVAVIGVFAGHWRIGVPKSLLVMPLVWLVWQFISATHSVDAEMTRATLKHFVACTGCFYLGAFCLSRDQSAPAFFGALVVAMAIVLGVGFDQHYGGLEETRKYYFAYVYPQLKTPPPEEFIKKISSDRIFATLFYPNALAGVILLVLPPSLVAILRSGTWLTVASRAFLVALFMGGGLACLYWSGSKGGWLLALLLAIVAMLHLPWSKRAKVILASALLICGIAGFTLKYAGFFRRGATSVSARFDYWRAAAQTTAAKPLFGTGPGTFSIAYQAVKRPESEMARLTHNDYLQQASDSGVVGGLAYAAFALGIMICGYNRLQHTDDIMKFSVWIGLLGWTLQGLLEFGLYIPALSWTAFGMSGWLVGANTKRFDKMKHHS